MTRLTEMEDDRERVRLLQNSLSTDVKRLIELQRNRLQNQGQI